jgi:hypothetical protein
MGGTCRRTGRLQVGGELSTEGGLGWRLVVALGLVLLACTNGAGDTRRPGAAFQQLHMTWPWCRTQKDSSSSCGRVSSLPELSAARHRRLSYLVVCAMDPEGIADGAELESQQEGLELLSKPSRSDDDQSSSSPQRGVRQSRRSPPEGKVRNKAAQAAGRAASLPGPDLGRALGGEMGQNLVKKIDFLGVLLSKEAQGLSAQDADVGEKSNQGIGVLAALSKTAIAPSLRGDDDVDEDDRFEVTGASNEEDEDDDEEESDGVSANEGDEDSNSRSAAFLPPEQPPRPVSPPPAGGGSALGGELLFSSLSSMLNPQMGLSGTTRQRRIPRIPPSLMHITSLPELVRALEPAADAMQSAEQQQGDAGARDFVSLLAAPSDTVVAMNHLKRLSAPRRGADAATRARAAAQMDIFTRAARRAMPVLLPKHVALGLNAAAGRAGSAQLFEAALRRLVAMRDDPVRDYAFSAQSVAMILNAFARGSVAGPDARGAATHRGARDAAVVACLAPVILSRRLAEPPPAGAVATPLVERRVEPPHAWNGQNIGIVCNALVKLGWALNPKPARGLPFPRTGQKKAAPVLVKLLLLIKLGRTPPRRLYLLAHLPCAHSPQRLTCRAGGGAAARTPRSSRTLRGWRTWRPRGPSARG